MAWSAREGSSSNNNTTTGWLRQEATLAEAEKKALNALQKSENEGSNVNDPLTAAMLPGMDPSTMMVRDNAIRRGDVISHDLQKNNGSEILILLTFYLNYLG